MADRMYLFRPATAIPPLCSADALFHTVTLNMLADMNELLDIRDELARKAAEQAENDRRRH